MGRAEWRWEGLGDGGRGWVEVEGLVEVGIKGWVEVGRLCRGGRDSVEVGSRGWVEVGRAG